MTRHARRRAVRRAAWAAAVLAGLVLPAGAAQAPAFYGFSDLFQLSDAGHLADPFAPYAQPAPAPMGPSAPAMPAPSYGHPSLGHFHRLPLGLSCEQRVQEFVIAFEDSPPRAPPAVPAAPQPAPAPAPTGPMPAMPAMPAVPAMPGAGDPGMQALEDPQVRYAMGLFGFLPGLAGAPPRAMPTAPAMHPGPSPGAADPAPGPQVRTTRVVLESLGCEQLREMGVNLTSFG